MMCNQISFLLFVYYYQMYKNGHYFDTALNGIERQSKIVNIFLYDLNSV